MENPSMFPFICDNFQEQSYREVSQKRKSRYFNSILLRLAKDNSIEHLEFNEYLRMITEVTAYSLNVERVSAWCFQSEKTKIKCVDTFEKKRGVHSAGGELESKDYPIYFSRLDSNRILPIADTFNDPNTHELVESYLKPHNIVSMMDVPLRSGGKIIGLLCCEHTGSIRGWTQAEQSYVLGLTAITGSALEIAERRAIERDLQQSNMELKKLNDELIVAKGEAEKANSAKSEFLTHMSHEIRTPLGAILGFIDILKDSQMNDIDRNEYLSILENNGKKLLAIINSILDLAKIEADKLDIHCSSFAFKNFMYELISLLEKTANDKNITLTLRLSEPLPDTIFTDPVRLYQVLINVIGNAIKFTHFGSVVVTVSSFLDVNGRENLSFEVVDTGIGMTEEQQVNIFARFAQADKSVNRKYGGLGVGLLLSKRLAQHLGGDVRLLRSDPSSGSAFVITVATECKDDLCDTTALPVAKTSEVLSHLKILCVEDSKDMQRLITVYLLSAGMDVDIASTGEEGVEKAFGKDYDIVLMDIQMPIMDGYRAVKLLHELGYTKPVIALTAHAMSTERDKCLAAGFTDYLTKPVDKNLLLQKIKEHVRRGPVERQEVQTLDH